MDGWEIYEALAAGALGCLLMYLGMRCIDWRLSRRTWRELERARDELLRGRAEAPPPESNLLFMTGRDPGDETD